MTYLKYALGGIVLGAIAGITTLLTAWHFGLIAWRLF